MALSQYSQPCTAASIDQTADAVRNNLSGLHKYSKLYEFPEFVKKADFQQDICFPAERRAALYADVRPPYQFPMHTKAATFVSYLYFLEKQADISPKVRGLIEQRLAKSAKYWGIQNDVLALQSKHAALNKSALPDSAYALVWATDDGRKERRYPMTNAMAVKAAAEWFSSQEDSIRLEYDFHDRQKIAQKILQKAAEFGADVGSHIYLLEKAAGKGIYDPHKAVEMINNRIKAANRVDPRLKTMLEKLAEIVRDQPRIFVDPAAIATLADTIDQFDRTHGLLNKYSSLVPKPEDVLFEVTYSKMASLKEAMCTTLSGSVYDKSQFSKLAVSVVRDVFGDDMADAVRTGLAVDPEKMADVAASLPRPDAETLDELMKAAGEPPMTKEARDATGFSFLELQSAASA